MKVNICKWLSLFAIGVMMLVVAGCAPSTKSPVFAPSPVYVSLSTPYKLQPISNEMSRREFYVVTGQHKDEAFSFQLAVNIGDGVMTVIGLTPVGQDLFSISYDGAQVRYKALFDALPIRPTYLLADLQFLLCDMATIQAGFWQPGVVVEQLDGMRLIRDRQRELVRIEWDPVSGDMMLEQMIHHYTYTFKRVS